MQDNVWICSYCAEGTTEDTQELKFSRGMWMTKCVLSRVTIKVAFRAQYSMSLAN